MLKSYPAIYYRDQQDAILFEEYKERLAPEQVVLWSRLMGGWQLMDSATTSPYDYPES